MRDIARNAAVREKSAVKNINGKATGRTHAAHREIPLKRLWEYRCGKRRKSRMITPIAPPTAPRGNFFRAVMPYLMKRR